MMIMGGGIVSWAQGAPADKVGVHYSFIIGVLCFCYLAFYAWAAGRTPCRQVDLERLATEAATEPRPCPASAACRSRRQAVGRVQS
jgi:FHS family L-fucose permease-like MFS transporter